MKDQKTVQNELNELRKKEAEIKAAIQERKDLLKPQTESHRLQTEKLRQEQRNELQSIKAPYWLIAVAAALIVFAIVNFAWLKISFMTIVPLALGVIVLIVPFVLKSMKENAIRNKYSYQIYKINQIIADIENADEKLPSLENELIKTHLEISSLEKDLRDIEIAQKIGTNNLFVYVDNICDYAGIKKNVVAHIKIDGNDRGAVSTPISIIPLTPGIHSVSISYYFPSDGSLFDGKEDQISVNESNRYLSVKALVYSPGNGLAFVRNIRDNLDGFLSDTKLSEYDIENYIAKL